MKVMVLNKKVDIDKIIKNYPQLQIQIIKTVQHNNQDKTLFVTNESFNSLDEFMQAYKHLFLPNANNGFKYFTNSDILTYLFNVSKWDTVSK